MNTFMENLKEATNFTRTENGALAHKTTNSAVYDMFATGGAYRTRSDEDCCLLFLNAYKENPTLAMKCLFYLRDCRGGQGERRFFRTVCRYLAENNKEQAVLDNLVNISEYGRWDDLFYIAYDTPIQNKVYAFLKTQLVLDMECKTPSLLAKWLPSENASSKKTKAMANSFRNYLNMTHKEYRKTLSELRKRINVLEKLMSANQWDKIEFDKIPSKAGLIYRNAFARRDIISQKYQAFMKDADTTVNAGTLYPYEIVAKTASHFWWGADDITDVERVALQKYWLNQPDWFEGKECSMMCVVDTSASMEGLPLDVACSLGMYCAERIGGPYHGHYISFSHEPRLVKVEGVDFYDKVQRIYRDNLCENTDLNRVFDLLKNVALKSGGEVPETIVVISDMQIDYQSNWHDNSQVLTEMERIRKEWEAVGLKMPHLVYWNVDARGQANILDNGPNVSYVSGCSPVIFKSLLTGKTGYELMLDKLNSDRYAAIV